MTKFDVVGFGALNVDMLFKVDRLALAEEESFIEDYSETCGGSAANTIVGLARLGCKVGFIGKVANDHEGKLQIDCFKTEGVDTDGIIEATKGKSGSVLGFVDKKGARSPQRSGRVNRPPRPLLSGGPASTPPPTRTLSTPRAPQRSGRVNPAPRGRPGSEIRGFGSEETKLAGWRPEAVAAPPRVGRMLGARDGRAGV